VAAGVPAMGQFTFRPPFLISFVYPLSRLLSLSSSFSFPLPPSPSPVTFPSFSSFRCFSRPFSYTLCRGAGLWRLERPPGALPPCRPALPRSALLLGQRSRVCRLPSSGPAAKCWREVRLHRMLYSLRFSAFSCRAFVSPRPFLLLLSCVVFSWPLPFPFASYFPSSFLLWPSNGCAQPRPAGGQRRAGRSHSARPTQRAAIGGHRGPGRPIPPRALTAYDDWSRPPRQATWPRTSARSATTLHPTLARPDFESIPYRCAFVAEGLSDVRSYGGTQPGACCSDPAALIPGRTLLLACAVFLRSPWSRRPWPAPFV